MKQSYKEGDILLFGRNKKLNLPQLTAIVKNVTEDTVYYHALWNKQENKLYYNGSFRHSMENVMLASYIEKLRLFKMMAAEGMMYNLKTREIVKLDRKYNFKTFDSILIKGREKNCIWTLHQFAFLMPRYRGLEVHTVGGRRYTASLYDFLPYNGETEDLLGTPTENCHVNENNEEIHVAANSLEE